MLAKLVVLLLMCALVLPGCVELSSQTSDADLEPTPTSLPGWQKFETEDIEIWLPDSWEGETIAGNDAVVIAAFETEGQGDEYAARLVVIKDKEAAGVKVSTYMRALEEHLPAESKVESWAVVTVDDYKAGRLEVSMLLDGVRQKSLLFIVSDDYAVWTISFDTTWDEFLSYLPTFEKSMRTFKVKYWLW
jgi:hypothetical protein